MADDEHVKSLTTDSQRAELTSVKEFFLIIFLSAVVRGTALWSMADQLQLDPDAYRQIAENILNFGVFGTSSGKLPDFPEKVAPTAYRPPLYPLLLAALATADGRQVSLFKVAVAQLLMGLGTIGLTWCCARWVFSVPLRGQRTWQPLGAAVLVACDPILLHQQSLLMTETLATLLVIASLTCLTAWSRRPSPGWAALSGLGIGLASLSRPSFLPWLFLVAGGMAFWLGCQRTSSESIGTRPSTAASPFKPRSNGRITSLLVHPVVLLVAGGLVLSPWALRNARQFGKPILTTTHGGYTLELANNPQFYDWLISRRTLPWDSRPWQAQRQAAMQGVQPVGPAELFWDRWSYQRAWQTIRTRPTDFLRACLYRVGQLWSPLPHRLAEEESTGRRFARWAVCGWYCGLYLLAAYGAGRLGRQLLQPPWVWGLLLAALWTMVHTLYWTNLRMRAPLMPLVALVASEGVAAGTVLWRGWERWLARLKA